MSSSIHALLVTCNHAISLCILLSFVREELLFTPMLLSSSRNTIVNHYCQAYCLTYLCYYLFLKRIHVSYEHPNLLNILES